MRFIAFIALTLGFLLPDTPAYAEDGPALQLQAPAVAKSEQVKLTVKVTNGSSAPCGLSTVAEGTVRITAVKRDGVELAPVLGRSFYLDGLPNAVKAGTKDVAPQSTVDVVLPAIRVHEGAEPGSVVLRSVAATEDGTGMDMLWPVGVPGRYEVTASYGMPGAGCAGVTGSKTVAFVVGGSGSDGRGFPWLWIVIGAAVLVLVLMVLTLVLSRRRRGGAAALLLLAAMLVVVARAEAAQASYSIDPTSGIPVDGVDFAKAVEGCLAEFAQSGNDPAGLLSRLKDPKTPNVRFVPTTGESGAFETPASKDGPGSSTVAWNPTSTVVMSDGVPRDPCSALYHELAHADDISRDKVPAGDCGKTGIKTAEVKATFTENKYRKARGLPERTEYNGKKLPKNMDACKEKPDKKPPTKGPVKLCEGTGSGMCGGSNGDPHLVTFDRLYYDFQAVGEFVLVRADGLEVQARQAPMGESKTVSVNSALAFKVHTQRVSLTIVDGETRVRVDGAEIDLPMGEKALAGGGKLTRRESDLHASGGYDLEWPDGSGAAVDQIGTYGYRLLIRLAAGRAGKAEGLLGNFDGDPSNDAPNPPTFEKLYPSYADSWRVKQSLFDYAQGQSTETFTDRSLPQAPATLDPAQRAQAEQICRWAGVTDPWQFAECVLDVGISGRSEFALSSVGTERIAPAVAAPIDAPTIAQGTTATELTFQGRKGQAVFADFFAPTLPDDCSPYKLIGPAGNELSSGCNISGVGYIERTELPADGQYRITVRSPGGKATIRVYEAKDTERTITAGGEVTAELRHPGSVARYRFTGKAGERVFVDAPSSSLPDQCSPLKLLDPSGSEFTSGCVINGYGDIEGIVLPKDGTYTLLVNPSDRTTGSVHLRLFSARDIQGTIAVDGAPVKATIGQPGAVVVHHFNGTVGMRVRLDATGNTLPDQCSPLKLLAPNGSEIASGCLIGADGHIPATDLPASGQYTIVVDPSDAATGEVTLRLHT